MKAQYTSVLKIENLYCAYLNQQRTLRILIPKAYFRYPQRHFSVMYMQDGQNLFEHHTAFLRAWGLREVMDTLPLSKQFIIVGIDNALHKRAEEYIPHSTTNPNSTSQAYIEFLIHTVKRYIDHTFRTFADREHTMIGGSSLGGLISFYAATRFGHVFGKAAIFSPSLGMIPEILTINAGQPTKMYVVGSKTESKSMAYLLEKTYWALKNARWPDTSFRIVLKDRGRHNEFFWGRNFRNMALFLMS